MTLKELTLVKQGIELQPTIVDIHVVREGKILAVELDPLNNEKIDSSYTYNNQVKERNPDAVNRLYLMDDKDNLLYIREKEVHESGDRYEIINETNLSDLKGFNSEINKHKEKKFNRIVVTDRVISINESNYNF